MVKHSQSFLLPFFCSHNYLSNSYQLLVILHYVSSIFGAITQFLGLDDVQIKEVCSAVLQAVSPRLGSTFGPASGEDHPGCIMSSGWLHGHLCTRGRDYTVRLEAIERVSLSPF
jgi:hypothetical protein